MHNLNLIIMKKYPFIFILFTFLVFQSSSCTDPNDPDGHNIPYRLKSKLKFVWIKPIYRDTSDFFQTELYFSGDYVAIGTEGFLPENKDKGIAVFHRMTGEKHPRWNRDPCCILEDNSTELDDFAIGGDQNEIAFLIDTYHLYAYDIPSGQKKWSFYIPVYLPTDQFTMYDDKVYVPYWPERFGWSTTWAKLARHDMQSGAQEDLFTMTGVSGYDFLLTSPVGYVDSNNDTLVIGVSQHYNFSNHAKMVWAYCFNVTQKTMKWENKTFAISNDHSRNDPQIIGNGKVMIHTMQGVYCFDIETGNLVWSKIGLSLSLNRTHLLYDNGRIYCRLDDGVLLCWDAETGMEIWRQNRVRFLPLVKENMVIYNGRLYFNSRDIEGRGVLNCVYAETGELLWRDTGLYGIMNGFILLDKNLGYLYGYHYGLLFCIDLKHSENIMSPY